MSSGAVYVVPGLQDAVKHGEVPSVEAIELQTPSFKWPNEVAVVPQDVFGSRAIVVPDGFLVPMKNNGGIYVIKIDGVDVTKTTGTVELTKEKNGYFYHTGFWVDLNGDGRKDFITARSNAKEGGGELIWLEHPEGGLDTAPWTEHFISSGPDVSIEIDTFAEFPGEIVVFAAEFFNKKLSFYRVSTTDGSLVASRVIDDQTILDCY